MMLADWEIEEAQHWFDPTDQPNLHKGALYLYRLVRWTNSRSDGWGYWRKPSTAAAKLMDLITAGREENRRNYGDLTDCTSAELTKALTPVKSLITREGDSWDKVLNPPPAPDPVRELQRRVWQEGWEHYRAHPSPSDPEFGTNPYE